MHTRCNILHELKMTAIFFYMYFYMTVSRELQMFSYQSLYNCFVQEIYLVKIDKANIYVNCSILADVETRTTELEGEAECSSH